MDEIKKFLEAEGLNPDAENLIQLLNLTDEQAMHLAILFKDTVVKQENDSLYKEINYLLENANKTDLLMMIVMGWLLCREQVAKKVTKEIIEEIKKTNKFDTTN